LLESVAAEEPRNEVLRRIRKAHSEKRFDLMNDLLLRGCVVQFSEDDHVLLLTLHHIASDGWSTGILKRELTAFYREHLDGAEANLPPLQVHYADFSVWQRRQFGGERLEGLLKYWREKLSGIGILDLPTDRPRPPVPSYQGARHDFTVPKDLADSVKMIGQDCGATFQMTLLAVFQILLSRYSGQSDVAVGTPVSGRKQTELEPLVGCFVNTLVLRTDLSNDPTFLQLLERVRELSLAAYEHQDLPFERLVEELQPERDSSRSAIIQVIFQLMDFDESDLALTGAKVTRSPSMSERVIFDLEMHLWQRPDGLIGSIAYATDLFDVGTIERMVGHFVTLLKEIVVDPNRAVGEIPFLTEPERNQILKEWNDTATPKSNKCIHQLFEDQVARTPDALAVVFEGRNLSYRELNEKSNRLASHLRKIGVGPGGLVALCVERSSELVVCILGILKSGGAYLPLDAGLPKKRLAFILEDASAGWLISEISVVEVLPEVDHYTVICIDAETAYLENGDSSNAPCSATADDLAYAIYTSGSTGLPKGVQIPHSAVVNFLNSMAEKPGMSPSDRLLSVTTPSFDISVLELMLPLIVGASVEVVRPELSSSPEILALRLAHSGASVMQATPATWQMLIRIGWKGEKKLKILCGGESLPDALAHELSSRCSELWNLYGPTETTIWSTALHVINGRVQGCIGHPIANTEVYVLDSQRQLVPVGVRGELYIGGEGLAAGYLNRPDLTAERFVENPFSSHPGSLLYRTGDLCKWRADGSLELLGRLDLQLKLHGFRIEPGEIEAALDLHASVSQSAVVLRTVPSGDRQVAAYCVAVDDDVIDSDLRAHLSEHLPGYMIPSTFVTVKEFPLNSSGKIDRSALPDIIEERGNLDSLSKPGDIVEFQLLRIWRNLFGKESIGMTDNFFDLGGHSMLAVSLLAEIEKEFGQQLPLATLFQSATIQALANQLRGGETPPQTSLVPLKASGTQPPLFIVHGWGGEVFCLMDFSRNLHAGQPVYGLRASDHYGAEVDRSVQEMASRYTTAMKTLQPEGPYFLAGYCVGGWIAYEMAQQLAAQGERIEMLAMIDTYASCRLPTRIHFQYQVPRILRRLFLHMQNWVSVPSGKKIEYFHGRWKAIRYLLWERRRQKPLPQPDAGVVSGPEFEQDYFHELCLRYQPEPYEGALDFFASDEMDLRMPALFRRFVKDGVTVHRVSGSHSSIINHNSDLEGLTHAFEKVLRNTQQKSGPN
tara:strand:+ start:182 stop:3883 length:3702 start_codon:yes stop_codon:yes gene_type:complete